MSSRGDGRLKPLSIAMPIIALLLIAFVSFVWGVSAFWSALSPDLRSGSALLVVSGATIIIATLMFAQSRGIASILPVRVQENLVNMSMLDIAQSIWGVTGDVADAAIVMGMRMDRREVEEQLERLPIPIRDAITTPGIINLAPEPIVNLILPNSTRLRLIASAEQREMLTPPPLPPAEPFLAPIAIELTERRIRNFALSIVDHLYRRNPFMRLDRRTYRALVAFFSTIIVVQLARSRKVRGAMTRVFQTIAFVAAIVATGGSILYLRRRAAASPAIAAVADTGTQNIVPSRTIMGTTLPSRTVAITGAMLMAGAIMYARRRRAASSLMRR